MSNALVIFIKNPVKGKVKTRLAKDSDDDYALRVYLELQRHTMSISLQVNALKYLYYSTHIQKGDMWDDNTFVKKVQAEGDLGQKMYVALHSALLSHQKVIIIGSDCIQLDHQLIELAYKKLDHFDVVIGPALDGGYYLLGIKSPQKDLFEGISWSTSSVLDGTIKKAIGCKFSCFLLPELSDVDYLEDWENYGYALPS